MAGEEHRDDLVAQLAVGQRDAGRVVLHRQQQREHVVARGVGASRVGDDVGDLRVDGRERGAQAAVARGRQPQRRLRRAVGLAREQVERDRERLHRAGGGVADLEAEQGRADDAKREPRHLLGDRHAIAVAVQGAPAGDGLAGDAQHRVGQRVQALRVERGLQLAPAQQPALALGGRQALADQPAQRVVDAALVVVGAVADEHALDRVGVGEHDDALVAEAQLEHVAELAPQLEHDRDDPAAHDRGHVAEQRADHGRPARSRGRRGANRHGPSIGQPSSA